MTAPAQNPGGVLYAVLGGIAVAALALPIAVVRLAPPVRPQPRVVRIHHHVVPQAVVPAVEPVSYVDLSPEDAREYNAGVPFSTAPNPPARPFRYAGSDEDLARATDCLAAAVLYEAGDDALGERAVAQVVLNRLRHPAFPKTVCGVVFEGENRSTGCQFTFTCDHALTRWTPSDVAWKRAREIAARALSGSVYKPVGYATHYHTDWVVPYWQSSLDKLAAVHSHLFFRWSGWWGTPPAFNRHLVAGEPAIAQLAAVSDAHNLAQAIDTADAAIAEADALTTPDGSPTGIVASDPNSFLVTLPKGVAPDGFPDVARRACGARVVCKFSGWTDPAKVPVALPLAPAQIATMGFSYFRDGIGGGEKALWNCREFRRARPLECMKQQVLLTGTPLPGPMAAPAAVATRGPATLGGVRRGTAPTPASPVVAPLPRATATPRSRSAATPSLTRPGTSPATAP